MNLPPERIDAPAAASVDDDATLLALHRLAESRQRLQGWVTAMAERREEGGGFFQPRSGTMRALMSLGALRLPWLRWGFSALMLLRSLRRR